MRFDRVQTAIIERIAEERNMDVKEVQKVIWFTFKSMATTMGYDEMPKVLIKGFGKYQALPDKIVKTIFNIPARVEKGYITEEEAEIKANKLADVILRRIDEEGPRICSKRARVHAEKIRQGSRGE